MKGVMCQDAIWEYLVRGCQEEFALLRFELRGAEDVLVAGAVDRDAQLTKEIVNIPDPRCKVCHADLRTSVLSEVETHEVTLVCGVSSKLSQSGRGYGMKSDPLLVRLQGRTQLSEGLLGDHELRTDLAQNVRKGLYLKEAAGALKIQESVDNVRVEEKTCTGENASHQGGAFGIDMKRMDDARIVEQTREIARAVGIRVIPEGNHYLIAYSRHVRISGRERIEHGLHPWGHRLGRISLGTKDGLRLGTISQQHVPVEHLLVVK